MKLSQLVLSADRYSTSYRGAVWCLLAVLAVLFGFSAFPAAAGADQQAIEFESGALGAPLDGQGDIVFPKALGYRPYRVDVGGSRAHSGTGVGDLGRCVQEAEAKGEDPGGCEGFRANTTGVLARTATSVSVFAGRFGPIQPGEEPEGAVLVAYGANGNVLGSAGPAPIGEAFDTHLQVQSAAGDIASFRIEAASGQNPGPDLGIDDLTVQFASGGAPDFSIAGPNQVLAIVEGQQLAVPVRISRLNGSSGPIALSAQDLPSGVEADPLTVQSGQSSATLVLRAAADAPDTDFTPTEAKIVATPLGPGAGPSPRTAPLSLRVAADFALSVDGFSPANPSPGSWIPIAVPDCAPVDVPVRVERDIAMSRDVLLGLRSATSGSAALPGGVSAEILPDATVAPGGDLAARRILRIAVDWPRLASERGLPIALEGEAGDELGSSTHVLPLRLLRASPHAEIADGRPGSGRATTPRFGGPGTVVRIHGAGFCRGTKVEVGNPQAVAPARLIDDHTIEFEVPRYATTGPITIDPPGMVPAYATEDTLNVDSFRNTGGFQFKNYAGGELSLGELREAFGDDSVFLGVNPCWPFGECRVRTGIVDPVASQAWGVLTLLSGNGGQCFGMTLGSQELRSGRVPYGRFPGSGGPRAAGRVFDLSGAEHPAKSLRSFLAAEQAKQFSDEFVGAWTDRPKRLSAQLRTLEREFDRNRTAVVALQEENENGGHSLIAYDMTQTATTADIYAYDPNRPFVPSGEESSGALHRDALNESVIHVDRAKGTWSFDFASDLFFGERTWSGGQDGSLWVIPHGAVPDDPSLPGLGALRSYLQSVIFGSADGSVRASAPGQGAEFLPSSDGLSGAAGPAAGTWVSEDRDRPLAVGFEGLKAGHYTEAYTAPGFLATASDVATARGVRDRVLGDGDSLRFASGSDRPLTLSLARRSGPELSTEATLRTHASAGGADTASLGDAGALGYAHEGAPTTLRFTLTGVRRDGGPATFASGPVAIRDGDRLRAVPLDRGLRRVRLVVRDARGGTRTRVLRTRAVSHGHVALGAPRLSGRRLSIRVGLDGIRGRAILGTTLRLTRGGHLVARRAVAVRAPAGTRRVRWRLPRRLDPGRYRLLSDVRALAAGAQSATAAGSATAHRAARVEIR